jgi:predicted short-subunit dehydrogenase-like oxidoreductase (DUF2520 family)
MDVVIIGAGNIAHSFGHLLKLNGHRITQIVGRSPENAEQLAQLLGTESTTDLQAIHQEADLYIVAVSDDAIPVLNDTLRLGDRYVVHTSGAQPLEAIQNISTHYGVIYPLQSLRKDRKSNATIPILIEAVDNDVLRRIRSLAGSLSDQVEVLNSVKRLKMHVAAVFCNNFTNHLLALTHRYCEQEALPFNMLEPLMRETFDRLMRHDPMEVQTGPAIRNDQKTMDCHQKLLTSHPLMQELYPLLSASIQKLHEVPRSER